MRLAIFSQSYPPMVSGAALVTYRLAHGLAARGHAVLVLAASERGQAYTVRDGSLVEVRLRAVPNPLRVGQRFVVWPLAAVRAALAEFGPDLLHLHDPTTLGLAAVRAARELGRPVVLTEHQLPWFVAAYLPNLPGVRPAAEALLWRYYAWWQRQCAALVAPSETIAGIVEAHTGRRPLAITNGVDLRRFAPHPAAPDEAARLRRQYGLHPTLPVLLYAGRLDADKRVDLVIRAAALALRQVDAQVVIAGDGRERARLERLAHALGLGRACRFLGYVSATGDLPGLYRLATVFATASEVEIQSSVVLEAAATGLPVVTVRASSMPEFVEDGVTGCLVPPGDVKAMAARVAELLAKPETARRMGMAALALAQRHSPEASLEAHERLYASILNKEKGIEEKVETAGFTVRG